ncbi:hypothetical protein CHUAL_009473 [Chamberlinius hualienensis]
MATKLEFDVEMSSSSCVDSINNILKDIPGVDNVIINKDDQQVFVETTLPSAIIQEKIESTNRRAVLKGLGAANTESSHLGAAVAAVTGSDAIVGVVRFIQMDHNKCIIDGTIDGLSPGEHGFHVYEYGDLSEGYANLGSHFNPDGKRHGSPKDNERHAGDLGNIVADQFGRASFRLDNDAIKVWDIIGRSLAISSSPDLFTEDYNRGPVVAGGVIARSAGLFQNPKRLCQCSGMTVWDERSVAQRLANSKI